MYIVTHGLIEFFHYDPYGQALAKLQRRHERDLRDVQSLLRRGLIQVGRLQELFDVIEPQLIRYPAISPPVFRAAVTQFCNENR